MGQLALDSALDGERWHVLVLVWVASGQGEKGQEAVRCVWG